MVGSLVLTLAVLTVSTKMMLVSEIILCMDYWEGGMLA